MCHRLISRSRITSICMPFSRYKIEIIRSAAFGAGIHVISGIQAVCRYSILILPAMAIGCKCDRLGHPADRTFIGFRPISVTSRSRICDSFPVMPRRRPDFRISSGTALIAAEINFRAVSFAGGPYGIVQIPDPVMSRGRNNTRLRQPTVYTGIFLFAGGFTGCQNNTVRMPEMSGCRRGFRIKCAA